MYVCVYPYLGAVQGIANLCVTVRVYNANPSAKSHVGPGLTGRSCRESPEALSRATSTSASIKGGHSRPCSLHGMRPPAQRAYNRSQDKRASLPSHHSQASAANHTVHKQPKQQQHSRSSSSSPASLMSPDRAVIAESAGKDSTPSTVATSSALSADDQHAEASDQWVGVSQEGHAGLHTPWGSRGDEGNASASHGASKLYQQQQSLHSSPETPVWLAGAAGANMLPSTQQYSPVTQTNGAGDSFASPNAKNVNSLSAWPALHGGWEAGHSPPQASTRKWRWTASGVSGGRSGGGAAAWGAQERIGAWRGLTAIEAALAGTREQLDHCHDQVRPQKNAR